MFAIQKKRDRAGIGRGQAQAHAYGGGLAGAVGSDHAKAFAGGNLKREVIDHERFAVMLCQTLDAEEDSAHRSIVIQGVVPGRRAAFGLAQPVSAGRVLVFVTAELVRRNLQRRRVSCT
jgi:hypothetical protein